MGLFLWVCFSRGRGLFSTSQKQLQSNEKQTNTTTQKDIFKVVFLSYHDMKTKAKKQTKICIYIRYRKKLQKKNQKKFADSFFCRIFASKTIKQRYVMKKRLTREQYAALRKYLVLIERADLPEWSEYPYNESGEYPRGTFPCYLFNPAELAKRDDSLERLILCGRRNPWNCAQIIAAIFPQVVELLNMED